MHFASLLPRLVAASLLCCGLLHSAACRAEDVIRRYRVTDGAVERSDFNRQVISEAMRRTVKQYGAWRFDDIVDNLVRERVFGELLTGERFNLAVFVTQTRWEEQLIPVRIPIDLGLSSYRVSLIHRKNQPLFAAITTEQALRGLSLTAGEAWSSRRTFEALGFTIQPGSSQNAMLAMLMAERVDLFPRSPTEANSELERFKTEFPDLAIEENLLIYLPLPTYIFVSPREPRLAERLQAGLNAMLRDGSLARLVREQHAALIKDLRVCQRRVFRFDNPLLSPASRSVPLPELHAARIGLCGTRSRSASR